MIDEVVDRVCRLAASARRRRRVRVDGPVRVNLGSGPMVRTRGWLNVDASAHLLVRWLPEPLLRRLLRSTEVGPSWSGALRRERFVFHDLRYGIPLPDGCAEAIYASHVLEHLPTASARLLLLECRRVVTSSGVVRVVVPTVDEDDDPFAEGSRYLHTHMSRWDPGSLRRALSDAGFATVAQVGYRVGRCPELESLDNRPDRSLYMEAYPLASNERSAPSDLTAGVAADA